MSVLFSPSPEFLFRLHQLKEFTGDRSIPDRVLELYKAIKRGEVDEDHYIPTLEVYKTIYDEALEKWKSRFTQVLSNPINSTNEKFTQACIDSVACFEDVLQFYDQEIKALYEKFTERAWEKAGGDEVCDFVEQVIRQAKNPEIFTKLVYLYPVTSFESGAKAFCYTNLQVVVMSMVLQNGDS